MLFCWDWFLIFVEPIVSVQLHVVCLALRPFRRSESSSDISAVLLAANCYACLLDLQIFEILGGILQYFQNLTSNKSLIICHGWKLIRRSAIKRQVQQATKATYDYRFSRQSCKGCRGWYVIAPSSGELQLRGKVHIFTNFHSDRMNGGTIYSNVYSL